MPKFSRHTLIALITLLTSSLAGAQTPARSCESLLSLVLPNASITGATVVPAGGFTQPGGRGGNGPGNDEPFCRVSATLKPTSDSDIKIEVWMPQSGWNQKFHSAGGASGGNSAVGGSINYGPMVTALERGYATAGTDLGHAGATFSYAPGHPEKVTDFGYRATHEMTVAAKALMSASTAAVHGYSYWNACAAGGRQGWHEVQRYPGDYDGLIVIDPANSWTRLQTWSMYVWQVAHATSESYIPPAKYPVIHQAAINRCDANDGATDGLISDPMRCQFDPAVLQCTAGARPNCLTAAQVDTARKIYAPARNPRTNEVIFPGLLPGSELGWGALAGPNPPYYATETYKYSCSTIRTGRPRRVRSTWTPISRGSSSSGGARSTPTARTSSRFSIAAERFSRPAAGQIRSSRRGTRSTCSTACERRSAPRRQTTRIGCS